MYVFVDFSTNFREIAEWDYKRDFRIDLVDTVSYFQTVIDKDGELMLRLFEDGEFAVELERYFRHRL